MKTIPHLEIAIAAILVSAAAAPAVLAQDAAPPPVADPSSAELKKLVAIIRPVGDSNVRGSVLFEKVDDGILITAKVGGLTPNSRHGIHIHEFGDLGSGDATSAGEHFNPGGHPHALPDDSERHAGDLGNLESDGDGNASLALTVNNITLDSGRRGILGRAVIVHSKADDGSQPSGNAGDRIGAGVIGISKDAKKDTSTAGMASPSARPADAPPGTAAPVAGDRDSEPTDGKPAEERKETRPVQPDDDETMDE